MGFVAAVMTGLAAGLLAYAALDIIFGEERRVRRRIDSLGSYTAGNLAEAEPLVAPFRERILKPGFLQIARGLGSVTPKNYRSRLRKRVLTDGLSGRLDPDRVLLFKLGVGVGAGLLVFGLARAIGIDVLRTLVMTAIAGLVLSYMPDAYLRAVASDRQRRILRELPDMLDMLTIAVEAGLGFDQAVARYVQHSVGPLGREFGMALMEIQAGRSRREALRAMGERVDVAELRTFIMAIVQADVFGVSVSDVLRTQSREMRTKRRQHAEEMSQRAPAKMAFPLVVCVLPATLIVVLTPAVIGIMQLFAGG